jgi:hypothetical protein
MKIRNLTLLLFLLVFASSACDSLLDTEPAQSVSEEDAIKDLVGVEAVLNGTYDRLQTAAYYGGNFMIVSEVLADNMKVAVQNSNRFVTEWTNRPFAHFGFHNTAYDIINRTNTVLKALPNVGGDQDKIDQYTGEALFIRALAHFDLLRSLSRNPNHLVDGFDLGIVIRTEPFSGVLDEDAFPSRSTITDVYTQIKKDLNDAIAILDPSTNQRADFPFKVSQVAAQALLSRVHLYEGNYSEAVTAATDAINNSPVGLTGPSAADHLTAFSEGAESLLEIQFTDAETRGLTSLAGMYRDDIGYGDIVPTDELLGQFEAGDVRLDILDAPTARGSETVRYSQKYAGYDGTALGTDNVIVIRLAEVYLNRAEAYAKQDTPNEPAALADLNLIRQQRGLAPLVGLTGQALIDAILKERRLELAFEGHRAYDLKRNGMGFPKPDEGITIPYDDYRIVAPYYEQELDANPNIVQNPGYTDNN